MGIISGVLGVVNSLIGSSGEKSDKWKASYSQHQQNLASARDTANQKEFAKHGIRWKTEDAKASGLHPLAALGAQTHSFQPQSVGDTQYRGDSQGQNLRRAISAVSTFEEKQANKITLEIQQERLKNMKLQNVGLANEISQLNQPTMPTGKPIGGVIQSQDSVRYVPNEIPMSSSHGVTSGTQPLTSQFINEHGTVYNTFSKAASEPMESDTGSNIKSNIGRLVSYVKGYQIGINPNKGWYKDYAQTLRRTRPKTKDNKWEYRYNVVRGGFVLRKKTHGHPNNKPGHTQFWDHARLRHIK